MGETCFVIMPIGSQQYGSVRVDGAKLRSMYDDLIREALLKARPTLTVIRADDLAGPGAITSQIFKLLLTADFVVADVTYPNPNVFYELGIRHACRRGTILVRQTEGPEPPFDIKVLRHIEYENTATGLKKLAIEFERTFTWLDAHPNDPDNEFLSTPDRTVPLQIPPGGQDGQVLHWRGNALVWDWVRWA